jgi:hypothetical protein
MSKCQVRELYGIRVHFSFLDFVQHVIPFCGSFDKRKSIWLPDNLPQALSRPEVCIATQPQYIRREFTRM